MKKVLYAMPVSAIHKEALSAFTGLSFIFADKKEIPDSDLAEAQIVIGNLTQEQLKKCTSLEWIQLDSAGCNHVLWLNDAITITTASGAYGPAIAEHMIGCTLMVMKNLMRYEKQAPDWTNLGSVRTLDHSTVCSVGTGDIGSAFLSRMHMLGSRTIGVRRTLHDLPEWMDAQYTMENMDEALGQSDVIALSLPETSETIHMFDSRRMHKMKKGSILINVGRGSAIVTDDLIEMAKEKWFSGICLDVTDPEPLPRNNALWNQENVYITPHISGKCNGEGTFERIEAIVYHNLKHYLAGEPLEHTVSRNRQY